MKKTIFIILLILSTAISAEVADGVLNIQSTFNVEETADRMENVLIEKGMTVFN